MSDREPRDLRLVTLIYVVVLAIAAAVLFALDFGNSLYEALAADILATLLVFGASRVLRNSSVYDPYWSVIPPFLALYWLFDGPRDALEVPALILVAVICLWSIRLTGNWVRRWQGLTDEDWRYGMLKDRFGSWEAFIDLSGIHLFPTLQVFIAMVPVGFAFVFPEANEANGSTVLFVLGMLLSLAAILIEHVADNQLAQFRADPGNKGLMLQSGLWGVVQHPNYVGEMLFWWGVWLASYGLTAALWTVAGPITMTVMFVGISIPMMNRRLERRRENEASENDPAAAH